jgi:hypothetical protein
MCHALPAGVLQLLLLVIMSKGESDKSIVLPEVGYCGQPQSGTCTTAYSNRLTVAISGHGSHTFTPTSEKALVEIQGISLELTELTPNRDKFMFVVTIMYTLEETLTISCRNDIIDETHQVLLKSGSCPSPITYAPVTASTVWESPECLGWEQDLLYTVRIQTTTDKPIVRVTDKNSYVLPEGIKGVANMSLTAENSCGEQIELDKQSLDLDATGTVALGGGESSTGSAPAELEKSVMIFIFIGIAPPILLLMVLFCIVGVRKVITEYRE